MRDVKQKSKKRKKNPMIFISISISITMVGSGLETETDRQTEKMGKRDNREQVGHWAELLDLKSPLSLFRSIVPH